MNERASATTLASELAPQELLCLLELVKEVPGGRCLEIGTAAGGTLCAMMSSFAPAERPSFTVVDPMTYFRDQLEIVRRNLRQSGVDPAAIDMRVTTSAAAFKSAAAAGERYDFIFIDGAHKIRYVTQDLRWTRLLGEGCIVCLHDYNDKHKGVKWSADRFLRRNANYTTHRLTNSLLALRKTGPSPSPEIDWRDRLWAEVCSPLLQLDASVRKRLPLGPVGDT